jgi:flagellar protein FliL
MAQAIEPAPATRRGGGKRLLFGLFGAVALGAAGFAVVYGGLLDPLLGRSDHPVAAVQPLQPVAFVPLEPIILTLPPGSSARHLRFAGQLEVVPAHAGEVASLMPRITDALNTYLRAIEVRDLEQPAATVWMRAQMLRRAQIVTGEGRVRDLLISEFVLN